MHDDTYRRIAAAVSCSILLAAAVALTAAGQGQSPDSAAPASAQAVVLFRAFEAGGAPAVDLTQADVRLKVEGRERPIRSLELVRFDPGRGSGPVVLEPPFATNGPTGRQVFILIDDESFVAGIEQPIRKAVRQLLLGLSPNDRVALRNTRGTINLSPTTRHGAIAAALAPAFGGGADADDAGAASCRSKVAVEIVENLFRGLAGSPPSTVFFVAGGFAAANTVATVSRAAAGPATTCELTPDDFNRVRAAAALSGLDFYVVQVMDAARQGVSTNIRGGTSDAGTSLVAGLENLAGTGGHPIVRLSGSAVDAMSRAASGLSAYYRLTFDLDAAERPGSSRRIDVTAVRSGVKVVAPSHVIITRVGSPAADGKEPSLRDMMGRTQVYRDVPLRMSAFASAGRSDREVKVVALFQPANRSARLAAASVGAFDRSGKLKAQWTAQPADLRGPTTLAAFTVPPGSYRLRLVAIDGAGRGGTVDDDVQVSLVKANPFKLSDLMLATNEDGGFQPALAVGSQSVITGYFEVYGSSKEAEISAIIELAESDDGPAIAEGEVVINTTEDKDTQVARGLLPVASLPPGDYAVRVIVKVGDRPVARLFRTLRKVAR